MKIDYKGIQVPEELAELIPYMHQLEMVREKLAVLGQQWDLLTILGQVCGTGTDMTTTREEFTSLTHELISNLGLETLAKFTHILEFKAQVTVDIVIRNLFERTADVGFLATDDDLRKFLTLPLATPASPAGARERLAQRFDAYVAKYSVYDDIVLVRRNGDVACRLDRKATVERTSDPFVSEALSTSRGYVEHYGTSELFAPGEERLIYAHRVHERGPQSPVLGVLVLAFRFQDELAGIFEHLLDPRDWTVLCLVDKGGVVKATSDALQLPVATRLPLPKVGSTQVVRVGGRAYLGGTRKTTGYQGFTGLGWSGYALLPLEQAFADAGRLGRRLDPRHMAQIAGNQTLFSKTLRDIARRAERVQAELDRTVWNGHLPRHEAAATANVAATKVLLREISSTGGKTKAVFEASIQNLYQTVITSVLTDAGYAAGLAIDIMDRNLYERANDCRWWALNSTFQRVLSGGSLAETEQHELSEILRHVNELYTVYSNLFVYDDNGRVVAVSNPDASELVGTTLEGTEVALALRQRDPQHYAVSAFASTPLYGDRPTYVYHAAIHAADGESRPVGGIGIVFDSEPEFRQMLRDALPRGKDGVLAAGHFSVFVDRLGRVISSSGDEVAPGAQLELDASLLRLPHGGTANQIIERDGALYALGAQCSSGYREYKSAVDCYSNDVIALAFLRLTNAVDATRAPAASLDGPPQRVRCAPRVNAEPKVDVATFRIGQLWLALKAEDVVEAISVDGLTAIPACPTAARGVVRYRDTTAMIVDPAGALGYRRRTADQIEQVVVIRLEGSYVGLVVDNLGDVPEVPLSSIEASTVALGKGNADCIEGIIKPHSSDRDSGLLLMLRTRPFVDLVLGGDSVSNLVELASGSALNDAGLLSA